MRAALRTDLEKRFGHDLDPLEGGSAPRHRSSACGWRGDIVPKRCCAGALPRHFTGVLNKGLGLDRSSHRAEAQRTDRITPASGFPNVS